MINVLAYTRVSTPGQVEADLSIPAQLKEIRKYAAENNLKIVEEYIDEGISAYKDENRRFAFNAMIQHAISDPKIKHILVHDPTRFSRDKYKSSAIKGELRKHGVSVISVTSPYDPNTIDGIWRESIDETLAMTTSMVNSFHTIKGMRENAQKRDPETGYCYKNGGRPPYGYKAKRIPLSKDEKGRYRHKLLWEIDPETAPILRKIVVDWRIGEGLSYKQIRDRLNSLKIPSPEGGFWCTSTIVYLLKEDRLLEYTGIYFWNKEDHRTPGVRYKDQNEWIKVNNAHPPIISMEEAEAALAISKSRQPRTPAARSYDSPWLLTGLNLEGAPFFTCKRCGGNIIGKRTNSKGHIYGKYICGTRHYKGKIGCDNNFQVNNVILEKSLLDKIEKTFGNPEAIDSMVKELNSRIKDELSFYNHVKENIENELNQVEKAIEATFLAFSEGLEPELCNERLIKLKKTRLELQNKLKEIKKGQPQPLAIDPEKARNYFLNLKKIFESGTNEQKRNLFKTYIRRMELDPDNRQVNVTFYPFYLQENIERGETSPRYISSGAGKRT